MADDLAAPASGDLKTASLADEYATKSVGLH